MLVVFLREPDSIRGCRSAGMRVRDHSAPLVLYTDMWPECRCHRVGTSTKVSVPCVFTCNCWLQSTWFRKNFRKDFAQHLMEHFPYFTTTENSVKKGRRSKGQAPFEATPETSCHSQNLAICHLFCCLCNKPTEKQANDIFSYTSSEFVYKLCPCST